MVKVKHKISSNSDKLSKKKVQQNKKTLNPFEVHINREKIKVLGRKVKNDRGLPGVSRAKALAKRKRTLLPEYQVLNKANKFLDKRIGERNHNLSAEEKSMQRYAAVRVKNHNKKSKFNLAEDEVLTHKGQTLSEIEKFDDPVDDDDYDDEDEVNNSGKLDRKFVEEAHFGGGMLKKVHGNKSHKDLIEELIAESKKRKAEMQKQKEATLELTEKLDSEWKDLLPLVTKKTKEDSAEMKKKVDDYDRTMRELIFEARGKPSDKLKTEDEIAREEREKLERLERERLERMNGNLEPSKVPKHRSADDLEDNFAYDEINDIPEATLTYNDEGKSNFEVKFNIQRDEYSNDPKDYKDNETSENFENEREQEEEGSECETDDDLSDLQVSDQESSSDEEIVNEYNKKFETIEKVAEKVDKNTNNTENNQFNGSEISIYNDNSKEKKKIFTEKEEDTKIESLSNPKANEESDDIREDLLRRKEIMEKARNELPYTFYLPESYENLQQILENQSPEHQGIIIERMIKCNHSSLKEGNKDGLGMLFVYLMQHMNDISCDIKDESSLRSTFKIFANLTPYIFDLAQMNPENTCNSLMEIIKEKQIEFRNRNAKYPGVDVLVFLKLVGLLCSTSDFKHLAGTPSIFFICQMLTTCKVKTRRDLAYGLFIVCMFLEYTQLSKRFLPQVIVFLSGILHMAVPKRPVQILKVLPPFKSQSSLLVISNKLPDDVCSYKLEITDLLPQEIDETFKHRALYVAVNLLQKFYLNYQNLPSCFEIFEPTLNYLEMLPTEHLCQELKRNISNLVTSLKELGDNRKLEYIVMEKKRPKALRLYEPNVQKIYDGKRHKVQSKEKTERDKLIYKVKKETKGALREIRRDRAFLGRMKLDDRLKSDMERKEKVKRIYAEASMQQSELNALDRSNKKRKK